VADNYLTVEATGKWRTSFSNFSGTGPSGGPSSPYSGGADYRLESAYNYDELLWRIQGDGTVYGFTSGKQQISGTGYIEMRPNITDDQIDLACSGTMSVTVTVSQY